MMFKAIKFSALVCMPLLFAGCMFYQPPEPAMTQLQVREIQSRELETADTKLVMKSVMNVLQDEGYIIKNVVLDVGLLSAEKNVDIENRVTSSLARAFYGPDAQWKKQQLLEASVNVSEFGSKTRVRINFQTKTIDNHGRPYNVETVVDALYYQAFFEKVSKGIFIQQQEI